MKKKKWIAIAAGMIIVLTGVVWIGFGKKIKTLYISLNSFKNENLAHTFQHTPEIQPTKKISSGTDTFQFLKEDNVALADEFYFEGTMYSTENFIYGTKTVEKDWRRPRRILDTKQWHRACDGRAERIPQGLCPVCKAVPEWGKPEWGTDSRERLGAR